MKKATLEGLCIKAYIFLLLILLSLLIPIRAGAIDKIDLTTLPQPIPTKPLLSKVMLDIAWCESQNNQDAVGVNYKTKIIKNTDGTITKQRYVSSRDIGVFQINDYYHAKTAKSLGLDIYTRDGNVQYALLLYNKNGTKDWNASRACWSNVDAWRKKNKSYY